MGDAIRIVDIRSGGDSCGGSEAQALREARCATGNPIFMAFFQQFAYWPETARCAGFT